MWLNKKRTFFLAFILVVIAAGGMVAFRVKRAQTPPIEPPAISAHISEGTLETQYGMHVSLVAVTGAGGFVDVRIKVVDGGKGKITFRRNQEFSSFVDQSEPGTQCS